MARSSRVLSVFVPLVGTALLLASGCGSGADDVTPPSGAGTALAPSLDQCANAIPDSVLAAFGWTAGPAATLTGGGCQRDAAGTSGSIMVSAPVLADPTPTGAEHAWESACAGIASAANATESVEPSVDWLGSAKGCARTRLTADGQGLLELYALTGTRLLDVTVSLTSPSDAASREAGARALVEAAASAW